MKDKDYAVMATITELERAAYARGFAAGLEQAAGVCSLQASELELEWPATIGDFSKHMVSVELAAAIRALAAAPAVSSQ